MGARWDRQPYARLRQGGADASYKEISVINPSRGLNLLISDILVNDKEATNGSKNIEFAEGGVARKRPGYTSVGTGLSSPTNGIGKHISESTTYPITSDAGTLKKFTSGVWTALTGAVTVDPTADISFTSLAEKTYAWDGVNGGVVWDGTTLTRPGTMPRAKFSVTYKGWHVASGVEGQPFRLYFAPSREPSRFTDAIVPTDPDDVALNDAANVPGATVFAGAAGPRAIDINRNDGEKVTGIGFFQDVLIIFKEQSIYQLYFNESNGFVVERISSSYGCVSHSSIASVENDCYFLSDNGVYVLGNEPNYYASIRTNELSSRVKPLLQQISPSNWSKCSAIYYDDRYWLTAPINSDSVNTLVVYDRRFYAWMVWDNIYANDMIVLKDDAGTRHFYFTDDQTAQLNEFTWGVYNDNGEPINAVFRTRAFEGKQIDHEKFWYVLHCIFRDAAGEVTVSYITERGSEGRSIPINTSLKGGLALDEIGLATFGFSMVDTYTEADFGFTDSGGTTSSITDASNLVYELPILLDSRTCKIEFANNRVNEGFTILGWKMLYQEKDIARFDGEFVIR